MFGQAAPSALSRAARQFQERQIEVLSGLAADTDSKMPAVRRPRHLHSYRRRLLRTNAVLGGDVIAPRAWYEVRSIPKIMSDPLVGKDSVRELPPVLRRKRTPAEPEVEHRVDESPAEPPCAASEAPEAVPQGVRRSLRDTLRRKTHLAMMVARASHPQREAYEALLELKHKMAWEAQRKTLWHWRTVERFFGQTDEAVAWPTSTDVHAVPSSVTKVRAARLPILWRALGLNDTMIARLTELRLKPWLSSVCELYGDDWVVQPNGEATISYASFKKALAPSAAELADMQKYYEREIQRSTMSAAKRKERESKIEAEHRKNRQWVVDDLDRAFAEWPPRIRVKQPRFSTKQRQSALAYAMDAGRLGRKAALGAAALSLTGSGDHVHLRAPGVRECLYACAKDGLGFGGLSAKEIVETCYVYCAERLQAAWRGQVHAKKFARARALWLRVNRESMRHCFRPWAIAARARAALRRRCLRKVVAWRFHVKCVLYRRFLFRSLFWPLHVWRRETRAIVVAKNKAQYVTRLWRAYTLLRHTRAWRACARKRAGDRRRADAHVAEKLETNIARRLRVWHDYASNRRIIRQRWFRRPGGGHMLLRRLLGAQLSRALAVWKYSHYLAKASRLLAAKWFRHIRSHDEARLTVVSAARKSRGAKRQAREKELTALNEKRPKPPRLPDPTAAPCFQASTLRDDQRRVCEPLRDYFENTVFPRDVMATWMRYWRTGPHALTALHKLALERRKENLADLFCARRCLARSVRAWRTRVLRESTDDQHTDGALSDDTPASSPSKDSSSNSPRQLSGMLRSNSKGSGVGSPSMRSIKRKARRRSSSKAAAAPLEFAELQKQEVAERKIQAKKCDEALAESRELTAQVRAATAKDKEREEEVTRAKADQKAIVDKFLAKKDQVCEAGLRRLAEYVDNFKEQACRGLVETVYKVYTEAAQVHERSVARHVFRSLRVPWAERRSAALLRRQVLRRQLAMCARLRRLDNSMPRYWSLRVKWRVWQALVELRDNHRAWRTPGLYTHLMRRRHLALRTTRMLRNLGARRGHSMRDTPQAFNGTVDSCFRRWTTYTQNRVRWRSVATVARRRRDLRTKHSVLVALCANAGVHRPAQIRDPALVRRSTADLSCYRTYFAASRKCQDLLYSVRQAVARRVHGVRDAARRGPSFKKLIHGVRSETTQRLQVEKQLLLEAFEMRGRVVSDDSDVAIIAMPDRPNLREAEAFRDGQVPTGCRIGGVTVVSKRGRGLVGLGSIVVGDGDSLANPIHGSSDGAQLTFLLEASERLVAVELDVGPTVVEAVRFHAAVFGNSGNKRSFGGVCETSTRVSPWFGARVSADAVRQTLAGPPDTEIVGFKGRASPSRVVTLGIRIRNVKEESIFSYTWTAPLQRFSGEDLRNDDGGDEDDEHPRIDDDDTATPEDNLPKKSTVDSSALRAVILEERDERCINEFVTILRYRHADCTSASARTEALARRVWSSRLVRSVPELRPLRKLSIIAGLAAWLHAALATPLPPLPINETEAKAALSRAKAQARQARFEKHRAERLERRVATRRDAHDAMMAAPENAELRTQRALQTPQWRDAESARLLQNDKDHAMAASNRAFACLEATDAADKARQAKAQMLRIDPRAPRVRACYARLITVARHQLQRSDTKVDARSGHGALPPRLYHRVLESILERRGRGGDPIGDDDGAATGDNADDADDESEDDASDDEGTDDDDDDDDNGGVANGGSAVVEA